MRELAIAAVWLSLSIALFTMEPGMQGDAAVYVGRGKWVALALTGVNLLRPVVKWLGIALMRKLGWMPPAPKYDEFSTPPPRPRIADEFVDEPNEQIRVIDDRFQPPPSGPIKPS